METPFPYATFPALLVHWDEVMATFAAFETRPYWSTVTWDTLALEPHVPWAVFRIGKFVDKIEFWKDRFVTKRFVRFAVPKRFAAFRFESPDAFPEYEPETTEPAFTVPETFRVV